jgi:integrase
MYRGAGKTARFLAPIEDHFRDALVKDISPSKIRQMAMMLYSHCRGASRNRLAIGPAQAVINFAAESELCQPIRVKRFKAETKVKEPATLEWVKAFMAEASPHLGAYALFMYLTGARPGEALAVEWTDIDLKAKIVLIRETKTGTERTAHLPDMLVVALANIPRVKGRCAFIYRQTDDLTLAWDGACKRAGIKRLTPHCCRHGFATGLLHRGVDVVTVAELGGWKSPAEVFKTYGHAIKDRTRTDVLTDTLLTQPARDIEGKPRKTGTS